MLLALLVLLPEPAAWGGPPRRKKHHAARSSHKRKAAHSRRKRGYYRPPVPSGPPVPAPAFEPPNTARSDFYKLRAPKMRYVKPDTSVSVKVEEIAADSSDATQSVYFNPNKDLSIVSEDTATLDLGEQSIVEMNEEVLIDSAWIKVASYYAIWDTRQINPYRMDGRSLRDTVHLTLVDPPRGRLATMPMTHTPSTSSFGPRWGRWHFGQDIDCETGDSVRAPFDGVVRVQNWDGGGYGIYLVLRHYNGLETLYGHLSKALVKPGDYVKAGDLIGWAGSTGRSTGSHLHFETRFEGNPFDPNTVYDFRGRRLTKEQLDVTAQLFNYFKRFARYARPGQTAGGRQAPMHVVRQGDILGKISRRYHVSIATLCRLNGITPTTMLRLGRRIRLR